MPKIDPSIAKLSKKEKLDEKLKNLEIAYKEQEISKWKDQEQEHSAEQIKVDKVLALQKVLESVNFDYDGTPFQSEPKFKNVFTEQEENKLKTKLLEIVKSF